MWINGVDWQSGSRNCLLVAFNWRLQKQWQKPGHVVISCANKPNTVRIASHNGPNWHIQISVILSKFFMLPEASHQSLEWSFMFSMTNYQACVIAVLFRRQTKWWNVNSHFYIVKIEMHLNWEQIILRIKMKLILLLYRILSYWLSYKKLSIQPNPCRCER